MRWFNSLAVACMLAAAALPSPGAGLHFAGALEAVFPHGLDLRLDDGRIITARFASAGGTNGATLATQFAVGDRIEIDGKEISTSYDSTEDETWRLEASAVRRAPLPATPEQRAAAVASPAWRVAGNLLPAPAPAFPPVVPESDLGDAAAAAAFAHARTVILAYAAKMPNFIATDTTVRQQASAAKTDAAWKPLDTLISEITVADGQEMHSGIVRNGKPWTKNASEISGMGWSNLMAGRLEKLLGDGCQVAFHFESRAGAGTKATLAYTFTAAPGGCLGVDDAGYQYFYAGVRGRVVFEETSGNVVRFEDTHFGFPAAFPIQAAGDVADWGSVTIDGQTFWLPLTSTTIAAVGGTRYQNMDTYSAFRHFGATTKIKIPHSGRR